MDYTSSAAPLASASLLYDLRFHLSFIFDYRYGILSSQNRPLTIRMGICITFTDFVLFSIALESMGTSLGHILHPHIARDF